MNPSLTARELRLYRVIVGLATCMWFAAFIVYIYPGDRMNRGTIAEICLLALNTMVMFGFGHALRTRTRVIRGIPWLMRSSDDDAV